MDGIALHIGRRSVPLDALLRRLGARQAGLLTAWNPFSRRRPHGCNQRMQRRLAERLHRFATLPADGGLRQWHEEHLLVAADARVLRRMGRVFRQRGLVELRRGQPPRLRILA